MGFNLAFKGIRTLLNGVTDLILQVICLGKGLALFLKE
jgi:hypothetical protein